LGGLETVQLVQEFQHGALHFAVATSAATLQRRRWRSCARGGGGGHIYK
jgi:hypothetical protein